MLFRKPRDFSKEQFKAFMFKESVELPDLLPWLKEWKKQVKVPVFALSNESKELNDYRIKMFNLHEVYDGFFSSCYLKMRKPDPRIFKTAMELAHVTPSKCLYFDDRPRLINASKKLVMNAILHQRFETTKNILEHFSLK